MTAGEAVEIPEAAAAAGISAATAGTLVVAAGTLAATAGGTLVVAAGILVVTAGGTLAASAGISEEAVEDPATTGAPASTPSASADLATRESTVWKVRLCPYNSFD